MKGTWPPDNLAWAHTPASPNHQMQLDSKRAGARLTRAHLVAEHSEAFLQGQLEPVPAGHPVTGVVAASTMGTTAGKRTRQLHF
eukprot:1137507-Pelagomonas_calceolata.AAC.4